MYCWRLQALSGKCLKTAGCPSAFIPPKTSRKPVILTMAATTLSSILTMNGIMRLTKTKHKMKTFDSLDENLDFAMNSEQEAVDFYTELADKQRNRQIRELFLEFAQEEVSHKARLQKIKEEQLFDLQTEPV